MKTRTFVKIIAFFVIILIVVSCGTDYKNEIIGRWKDQHNSIVEFTEDGVVKGLARNIKKEIVDGTYKVSNDSLVIEFITAPVPRNIKGSLEFKIYKLDKDSLILYTSIGNINYAKLLSSK